MVVLYTTTIGPFSTNTTLSKINVSVTNPTSITVTGTLVDCNGAPLATGLAYIHNSDTLLALVPTDANGQFQTSFYRGYPLNTFTVTAYNAANPLQSLPISATVVNGVANVGTIPVCTNVDEYVILQINGTTRNYYLQTIFGSGVAGQSIFAADPDSSYVQLLYQLFFGK